MTDTSRHRAKGEKFSMLSVPESRDWITVDEAAELTGMSRRSVGWRLWHERKKSPRGDAWQSIKHDGKRLILRDSLPLKWREAE